MSNIRIVKYSEDLFKIPSGTQKKKKPDKPIKIKSVKPVSDKTIKNRILNEIRKNQEKQYKSLLDDKTPNSGGGSTNEFENDFEKSVEYMTKLADKHKEEARLNRTIKSLAPVSTFSSNTLSHDTNLIPVVLEPDADYPMEQNYVKPPPISIPYGCLKGGSLPTYRTYYNKTLKQIPSPQMHPQQMHPPQQMPSQQMPSQQMPSQQMPSQQMPSQQMHPQQMPSQQMPSQQMHPQQMHPQQMHPQQMQPQQMQQTIAERIKSPAELLLIERVRQKEREKQNPKQNNTKIKKLLRRTYRIGRDKYRPKIGILLPNKTIRSNVTTKSYLLKQTPIDEIRKVLVKQGFIKVGSSAPNDVLRKIYESIQMIGGDINNHNPDNLLYNFFNEKQ
jgi:hypothetical protein